MKTTTLLVLFSLLLLFPFSATQAQQSHWIKVGTNAPYQHALQYEWQFSKKTFVALEAGYFSKGYQEVVFDAIQQVSNNPIVPEMVRSTMKSGRAYTLRLGRMVGKRFHVAGFAQELRLQGQGRPTSLIGSYFDVTPDALPTIGFRSSLYQVGLNAGFRQPIGKRFAIHAELGFSRTVGSTVDFSSDSEGFNTMSAMLTGELKKSIKQYGYLPSVNIYIAYRFAGTKRVRSKAQQRVLSWQRAPVNAEPATVEESK